MGNLVDPAAAPERGAPKRSRVSKLIAFASDLERHLPTACKTIGWKKLHEDTEKRINSIEALDTEGYQDEDLEAVAIKLSNLARKLRKETQDQEERRFYLSADVLGFLMLDRAQYHITKSIRSEVVHLMKIALKLARTCIDEQAPDLVVAVLRRAGIYENLLSWAKESDTEDDKKEAKRFQSEFFLLRTAVAWRQGKMEVAEHMFHKFEADIPSFDVRTAEQFADVMFSIGQDFHTKKDFVMADRWLDRALATLTAQELHMLSPEGAELRIDAIKCFVKVSLELGTEKGYEQARKLVSLLEADVGDQPVVLLLRLELIDKLPAEAFDVSAFADVMRRMIRSMGSSESRYKLIVHHIMRLCGKDAMMGNTICNEYLEHLSRNGEVAKVDELAIRRVHMMTSQRVNVNTFDQAHKALIGLAAPLGPAAAASSHLLMVKMIDAEFKQKNFDIAAKWCQLALHDAFQQSGASNLGKIGRKLLNCQLELHDLDGARSTFYAMDQENQEHPLSVYLVYKVAVRSRDHALALECLGKIKDKSGGHDLIHGCVLEANRSQEQGPVLEAMQALMDKYEQDSNDCKIHLPALLRCIIRLKTQSLEGLDEQNNQNDKDRVVRGICAAFDQAVRVIKSIPNTPGKPVAFDVNELEWFSVNAYNLAMENGSIWKNEHIIRLLDACLELIELYPSDVPAPMAGELALRTCFLTFMGSAALIANARAADTMERRVEAYKGARQTIFTFDATTQEIKGTVGDTCAEDLLKKWGILSVFDFEAAANIGAWDELGEIVRKAGQCKSGDTYRGMADCLIRSNAPAQEVSVTLRLLIDELWAVENFSSDVFIKYCRLLLQVTIARDTNMAFGVLQDICKHAEEAVGSESPFPPEQLEWIASTAFNEAINFRGMGDMKNMEIWADRAIALAGTFNVDGVLTAAMQENLQKMRVTAPMSRQ